MQRAAQRIVEKLRLHGYEAFFAGGWVRDLIDKGGYEALPGAVYTDETYGHPGPGFHITCGAQKPGQYNTPHDHGAGWVVYGTYQGAIEQTRWGWDYSTGVLAPKLPNDVDLQDNGPGEPSAYLTTGSDPAGGPKFRVRVSALPTGQQLVVAVPLDNTSPGTLALQPVQAGDITSAQATLRWTAVADDTA